MRNAPIDPFAAQDIRDQVDKVLSGLGNPAPPVDLREVRELLKLDRQFYSSTNTGPLRESISAVKIGAKQIAKRPTLILDVVRKAGLKALWLPDRRRILIDEGIPDLKKRHTEAHEITHSITPHHQHFLFGDDEETLRSSCHEKLEAEANYGSGRLLFLGDRFEQEASELPRTLATVKRLAKGYGNTITMTLWRLVEEAHQGTPMFGVISVHPIRLGPEFDPRLPCRYFIESPAFRERFGNVTEASAFQAIQRYASGRAGGPLGVGEQVFIGQRGERHLFRMETFFNGYRALTLGTYVRPVATVVAAS